MGGHPHGLLGHMWHGGLSRVRKVLRWQSIGGHLGLRWHRAPGQVSLRTRGQMGL